MGPDRIRWTDSRLDDLANELRSLRDLPHAMGKFEVEMTYVRDDVKECAGNVKEHAEAFKEYVEAQEKAAEERRQEQVRIQRQQQLDRRDLLRWIVGTTLVSAGLVIAALGLILGSVR